MRARLAPRSPKWFVRCVDLVSVRPVGGEQQPDPFSGRNGTGPGLGVEWLPWVH